MLWRKALQEQGAFILPERIELLIRTGVGTSQGPIANEVAKKVAFPLTKKNKRPFHQQAKWNSSYQLLCDFKATYGHLAVPRQVDALAKVDGWSFIGNIDFDERVQQCLAYQAAKGDMLIPTTYEGHSKLGRWAAFTRQHYQAGKLTTECIAALKEIKLTFILLLMLLLRMVVVLLWMIMLLLPHWYRHDYARRYALVVDHLVLVVCPNPWACH